MQKKFFLNPLKNFFYIGITIILIASSQTFTGCGGSDEVEVTQRDKDSIATYLELQKSFALYRKALTYNEANDNENAKKYFEFSLKNLKEVNIELISEGENYFWKQDYDELAKSIVEDYLITQPEINENSLVFQFASKIPVSYKKIEEVTQERQPLPKGSDVPFVMNSAVEQYIEFFSNTDRGRAFVDKCLYRSGKYFPLMQKILKINNAPEELVYLSVQESGLNPTIVSRAGAVGLWQFMPATGRSYGLYSDGYLDDRRDFEKATDAAANLLKDLYRTFDDWYLAFCGYNAGPGRVRSAIKKSGSRDFWSLRGYLPGETKNYVPSIIALSYVMQDPAEYGFKDVEYGEPISFDRVNLRANITLQKVAELSNSDIETIRDLNPELTSDIVPVYDEAYQLRIPHKSYDTFAKNFKNAGDLDNANSLEFAGTEVSGYMGSVSFVGYKVDGYDPGNIQTIGSTSGKKKVTHEYNKKVLLSAVAVYYEVRPTDIRLWNNISYGDRIKNKQKLNIYLSEENYRKLHGKNQKFEESNDLTSNDSKVDSKTNTTKQTNAIVITSEVAGVDPNGTAFESTIKEYETESISDNSEEVTAEETETETITDKNEQLTVKESDTETITESPGKETVTESKTKSISELSGTSKETESETESVTETSDENSSDNSYTETESTSTEYYEEETVSEPTKTYVPETKTVSTKKTSKSKVYTVKGGDNLTMIADDFGVSISDIKEWNDLESDKILVGQKLKVVESSSSNKKNKKTSGSKRTYKVKKGETLASISGSTDISISNLKKWNNLKSDKILVGQVLKLYGK